MTQGITKKHVASGMTLLEIVIVIGIVGILLGSFLAFYAPTKAATSRNETQVKIDKVMDAVASYALKNNRLPPASSNANGTLSAPGATTPLRGIIPYAELGLSRDDAKDANGHFMTYVVAPVAVRLFSATTSSALPLPDGGATSFDTYRDVMAIDDNRSPFCYNNVGKKYFDKSGTVISNTTNPASFAIRRYLPDGSSLVETDRAFVAIIAHGAKALGGYNDNATAMASPPAGTSHQAERDNATKTDEISIAPFNPSDNTAHFDDIVSYMTGPSLVSRLGNTNCHDYTELCSCRDVCRMLTDTGATRYDTATSCRTSKNHDDNKIGCYCGSGGTGGKITSYIDTSDFSMGTPQTMPASYGNPANQTPQTDGGGKITNATRNGGTPPVMPTQPPPPQPSYPPACPVMCDGPWLLRKYNDGGWTYACDRYFQYNVFSANNGLTFVWGCAGVTGNGVLQEGRACMTPASNIHSIAGGYPAGTHVVGTPGTVRLVFAGVVNGTNTYGISCQ